jgi:hypothetical protein
MKTSRTKIKINKILFLLFCLGFGSVFILSGCSLFSSPKKIAVKIPKKFKYALKTGNIRKKRLVEKF